MTAVKNHEADRFAAAPPRSIGVFLVFGTDAGLISERVQKLTAAAVADPKDPFQLVRVDGDELAGDPGRLIDEVATVPLFGGRRAVLVEAGTKNFAAAVEPVLALPARDCSVIIEAGALKRDAPLRKLVERSRQGAAIECFPDEMRDLARLIDAEAGAAGLTVAAAAREALVHLLGADRLTTRGELAKLTLYAHGTGRITLDDVETIVADASAVALDAAIDGAYLGNVATIEATVARVFAEGGDPGVLVGAALRHGLALHRARLDLDGGRPVGEVIDSGGRFGLYFKRRQAFESQVQRWSAAKLARAIDALADAIAKCRLEPRLGEAIAARALWAVALATPHR
ncbi:MAG: DNA polymerase III subunit delta [Methylobacteriaceae bacterium]|nr:DNA polymerase III subunit delta [Methylobacteriaceae bacterium]MBV9633115.1 DNA polymerase III subunit delta [Methylobacteriaceae bacterium]MBV9705197.1 DNA polymerase III subunit delta [Methylobacteriaceae bacterium]